MTTIANKKYAIQHKVSKTLDRMLLITSH